MTTFAYTSARAVERGSSPTVREGARSDLKMIRHRNLTLLVLASCVCLTLFPALSVHSQKQKDAPYYPVAGETWLRRKPEEVGMDSALLDQALAYAKTQASTIPSDFSTQVGTFCR